MKKQEKEKEETSMKTFIKLKKRKKSDEHNNSAKNIDESNVKNSKKDISVESSATTIPVVLSVDVVTEGQSNSLFSLLGAYDSD